MRDWNNVQENGMFRENERRGEMKTREIIGYGMLIGLVLVFIAFVGILLSQMLGFVAFMKVVGLIVGIFGWVALAAWLIS